MHYKVEYQENTETMQLDTVDACLGLLEHIEKSADHPVGVYITRNDGECLSCVLGASTTAFVWYPAKYNGIGTWSSQASKPADRELDFWLCGHHTQAATESQVDRELLSEVVKEFLEKGTRSGSIQWVRD